MLCLHPQKQAHAALPFPARRITSSRMNALLLIAAGGAAGSVARYSLATWLSSIMSASVFPWGIFLVNVSGCFAFGLIKGLCHGCSETWSLTLLTGVLGGYTTFSTFGWDTFAFIQRGQPGIAAANAIASVTAGVLAVWLGVVLSGRAPQ
jgi:fluoride exporter